MDGKPILSMYSPDKPYRIYSQEEWWSDKWEPKSYGKGFDFNRGFFEQFDELLKEVPLAALNAGYFNMVNSEYNNAAGDLKNCYLTFQSDYNEDCYYSYWIAHCKNSSDVYRWFQLENSYWCIDCKSSYKLFHSQDCDNCTDSYYLYNCNSCKNCYACTNLSNKSYCIENKEYTKEAYFEKLSQMDRNSKVLKNQDFPVKSNHSRECENSTWDYIYNLKDSEFCFDCVECRSCKYCDGLQLPSINCSDISQFWWNTELCYESVILWKKQL